MMRHTIRRTIPTAALLMFAIAGAARAADDSPRTITTTGTATVYIAPDQADVRFAVHTFDADLAKAKADNDDKAGTILAFIRSQDVDEKSIQTDNANASAVYEEERNENGRIVRGALKGYTVTRSYNVRLDDLSKFSGVIDRLLTDAAVTLNGHSLRVKQDRKHRDDARQQAARAAREKAELLA